MAPHRRRFSTEVKAESFIYEWEIHNFNILPHDNGSALESSVFSMGNDKVQWKLLLYPRGDSNFSSDCSYTGIFLRLISNGTAPMIINAKCEISMITKHNIILKKAEFVHNYSTLQAQNGWSLYLKRDVLLDVCKSAGSFIVQCKIERPMSFETKPTQCSMKFHYQKHRMEDDFRQLFKEPNQFSDVTLLVGNEKFPAHKIFLAMRSSTFAAMFRERELQGGQTNEVRIEDAEPKVVQAMLEFLYTDRVIHITRWARKLIAMAHKYELKRLKALCEKHLYQSLDTKNAGEIIMLADLYGCPELVRSAIDFIGEHLHDVVKSGTYHKIQNPELLKRILQSVSMK